MFCSICLDDHASETDRVSADDAAAAESAASVQLRCGHSFGTRCLVKWCDHCGTIRVTCPLCRIPLGPEDHLATRIADWKLMITSAHDCVFG